jgi:hypothetical protein
MAQMAKWDKQRLKLAKDHSWRAKPGYQIVVLDRGAVRFDVPQGWGIAPGEGSIELRDRPSPDDRCLLEVSVIHLPAEIDWSGLPLGPLLEEVSKGGKEEIFGRGAVSIAERPGVELAWRETRYVDPGEHREARSRSCLARGAGVYAILTMSFWPEDAAEFEPVWTEVLRSLRLGEYREATTGRPVR